ncbi:hypothetical protein BC826DRAFT_481329 [Russula brevipes]|nr:hypothetical protein BC826DRAFT_481329 [Russula brevipes]
MGAASSPLLLTFAFHRITQLILCHVSCPASSSHPSTRSCRIPCYRLFQCAQHHDPPDAYSGLSPTPCQLRASRPSTVSHHPQLAMSFFTCTTSSLPMPTVTTALPTPSAFTLATTEQSQHPVPLTRRAHSTLSDLHPCPLPTTTPIPHSARSPTTDCAPLLHKWLLIFLGVHPATPLQPHSVPFPGSCRKCPQIHTFPETSPSFHPLTDSLHLTHPSHPVDHSLLNHITDVTHRFTCARHNSPERSCFT